MAREILLRLALRNYERARDVAGQIADRAERTLATARSLAREVKDAGERAQRSAAPQARARASASAADGSLFDRGAFRVVGQAN